MLPYKKYGTGAKIYCRKTRHERQAEKMNIEELRVDDLIPYENNPRNNEEAVDKVALSISSFGFKVPIIVDRDNVIVAGHTRHKAAKKLGLTTVPVIRADDLTDDQIRAFRLADNKVSEFATWDLDKLEKELDAIQADMSLYGFDSLEQDLDGIQEPDIDEAATDDDSKIPESHVYIFAVSLFGKTLDKHFAARISEGGAEKVLEKMKNLTEEENENRFRRLWDDT